MQDLKKEISKIKELIRIGVATIGVLIIALVVIGGLLLKSKADIEKNTAQNKIDREYKVIVDSNRRWIKITDSVFKKKFDNFYELIHK